MSALRIARRRKEKLGEIRRIYLWGHRNKPTKPKGWKARAKQFMRWIPKAFAKHFHTERPPGKLHKRLHYTYWVKVK